MKYVIGSGVVYGKTTATANPEDEAMRKEIVVILHRLIAKVIKI